MNYKYVLQYLTPVYYNLLNGKLFINGSYSAAQVIDGMAIATAGGVQIILGERTINQQPSKCNALFEVIFLVQVIAKGANFGFKTTEDLANQIMGLINTTKNPDCSPDFAIVTTECNTWSMSSINPTDEVFRTMIRFTHQAYQLT